LVIKFNKQELNILDKSTLRLSEMDNVLVVGSSPRVCILKVLAVAPGFYSLVTLDLNAYNNEGVVGRGWDFQNNVCHYYHVSASNLHTKNRGLLAVLLMWAFSG
jgi:hypothetical protein